MNSSRDTARTGLSTIELSSLIADDGALSELGRTRITES